MLFVFAVFIGLWEMVTRLGFVSPIILPTPAETLQDLIFVGKNLIGGSYMTAALWVTIREVIYGFAARHRDRLHARRHRRRDRLRRAGDHALPRRHRHHAQGRLRAALRRLAGLRHRLEGGARRLHRHLPHRRRHGGRAALGRRERAHAVQDDGRQPVADALAAQAADRACRTSSPGSRSAPSASWPGRSPASSSAAARASAS